MPSSRANSDRAVEAKISAAMAKDPGKNRPRDASDRARNVLGGIQPVSEDDRLLAGKYVRKYAVREGLKMRDIQDVLDMLGVP